MYVLKNILRLVRIDVLQRPRWKPETGKTRFPPAAENMVIILGPPFKSSSSVLRS